MQALDGYPMINVPPSPGLEPDQAPKWGDKPSKGSRGAMHVHAYAPAVTPKLHAGELLSGQGWRSFHIPR